MKKNYLDSKQNWTFKDSFILLTYIFVLILMFASAFYFNFSYLQTIKKIVGWEEVGGRRHMQVK